MLIKILGPASAFVVLRLFCPAPRFWSSHKFALWDFDGPWFFVPKLRRVFGWLDPNEIAASRDFIGEFVRRPLSQGPVRTALIIQPRYGTPIKQRFEK
jgi:hypothetical protein